MYHTPRLPLCGVPVVCRYGRTLFALFYRPFGPRGIPLTIASSSKYGLFIPSILFYISEVIMLNDTQRMDMKHYFLFFLLLLHFSLLLQPRWRLLILPYFFFKFLVLLRCFPLCSGIDEFLCLWRASYKRYCDVCTCVYLYFTLRLLYSIFTCLNKI